MAQKLPMLEIQKPMAETINNTQPVKLIVRFVMAEHATL